MSHLNNSWAISSSASCGSSIEKTSAAGVIKTRYQQIAVLFCVNVMYYKSDRDNWAAIQRAKMLSSTYKLNIHINVYLCNYLVIFTNIMS